MKKILATIARIGLTLCTVYISVEKGRARVQLKVGAIDVIDWDIEIMELRTGSDIWIGKGGEDLRK